MAGELKTIRKDGRDIPVPTERLPLLWVANFSTVTIVQRHSGCLVLRASGGSCFLAGSFLAIGIGLLVLVFLGLAADNTPLSNLVCGAVGVLFLGAGTWFYFRTDRYSFDLDAGQFTRRNYLTVTTRPLGDIVAVQLLQCGARDFGTRCQLNLVVDDRTEPRYNLTYHIRFEAARAQAAQLAEFLAVPLLEQAEEGLVLEKAVPLRGREVIVRLSPLKTGAAAGFRTMALHERPAGCLVFRTSLGVRLFGGCFLVAGLLVLMVALAGLVTDGPAAWVNYFGLVWGLVFAAAGWYFFSFQGCYEFDKNSGRLIRRRGRTVKVRPLSDILAVQLIDGGYYPGSEGPGFESWHLNLILDDDAEPRWNLSNHANLEATRRQATRLAEFLGVPLLDRVAEEQESRRR